MRLGLYTFASLSLVGLVTAFAYTLNPGTYTVELAGINLTLPVALWIAIPMLTLLVVTIFHMLYYSTKNYFTMRKWNRDSKELEDAIYWSILKEPKKHNFTMPKLKSSAEVLSVASLDIHDSPDGLSEKLSKTIKWVKKIEAGEYIDLTEKKVAKFMQKSNPLVIQNSLNRIKSEPSYADSVMEYRDNYDESVSDIALDMLVDKETLFKVKKYSKLLSAKQLCIILDRVDAGEDLGLTVDMAKHYAQTINMKCKDFMRLAESTLKRLTPDENLALFKELASANPKAENAYLYLLFQYEMLDAVKSYLEESNENEFMTFRAIYMLKKEKHKFRISDIANSSTMCNEN